ncbi:hypothetical protein [Planomonospora venezuelensis]|uniref:SH3 domain-containing protein n=1 Tax=Planomonospora venezuelensis TaxID=1999 RepID=A0A841D432_PLAVE|nr:hypothetical protein [Planomonospora venezuelensis]MBB5962925.1 hypothetical protein [Planomonospora venezuelensis]GIN04542.1 hypothetical protein Pve01_62000 [Planomonospora venezuelensis]
MKFQRLASTLAAATVAGGGLIALSAITATPASAETACFYKVRNVSAGSVLNVHRKPGIRPVVKKRYKVIDVLYPNQTTVGQCRRAKENWRWVIGNSGLWGGAHKYYLNKGRKFQFTP